MQASQDIFRVGAAIVTQCHRILKADSPWAPASGPASSVLLLALRLGFEVTLKGDIKWGDELIEIRKVTPKLERMSLNISVVDSPNIGRSRKQPRG
eukprot:5794753-Amphidinium_carterae.1